LAENNQVESQSAPAPQPTSEPEASLPSPGLEKSSPEPAQPLNPDLDNNVNRKAKLLADFFNGEIIPD
jgi:hypothetical protein